MMTNTYLNVGVGQVQAWLSRSPDLRGRRGASSLLARMTARDAWSDLDGATWNDEAGEVSGVVALVVREGADPSSVARTVIRGLRRHLPGTNVTASWAAGDSYVGTYDKLHTNPDGRLESLPATNENPLAARCARCSLDPAVTTVTLPGKRQHAVCSDCWQRYEHAGTNRDRAAHIRDITDWLTEETERAIPEDLRALARSLGDPEATRVAIFYADGNAVGQFIKTAVEAGLPKDQLVVMINEANTEAFQDAARTILDASRPDASLPLIPHLVAGDDVLVSLAAPVAWEFATTFVTSFDQRVRAKLERQSSSTITLPSASGALVFHHHSSPLPTAITHAEDLLRDRVKKERDGAALGFVDLIAEDPEQDSNAVQSATWVIDNLERATHMAALPVHHLKRLMPLLRRGRVEDLHEVEHVIERSGIDLLVDLDRDQRLWLLQMASDLRKQGADVD